MKIHAFSVLSVILAGSLFAVLSPLAAADATVVRIDPNETSPFNGGVFEGWGTSLCWWGNRIGYDRKLTDAAAKAFFSTKDGLMLNIVRYNIGGGDDPSHDHIKRSDSNMPGFAQPLKDEKGEFLRDEKGLVRFRYDWSKDANQVNVLKAILKENPGVFVEAFANSPPYFMTHSGCTGGGLRGGQQSNLNPAYVDAFADFLATVTAHFRHRRGIRFRSIEPVNEPGGFWYAFNPKQECCHYSMSTLNAVIPALDKALKRHGVRDIVLAAADDGSYKDFLRTYNGLSQESWEAIDRVNIHTYFHFNETTRPDARDKIAGKEKNFWMSEVDGDGSLGKNSGEMGPCLWLAQRIIDDVNGLRPSAWVIWLVVDRHYSDFDARERGYAEPRLKYWGTAVADHFSKKLIIGKRYYAFGQFTRFIRPGDRIVGSSDFSVAAINPKQNKIVIVALNAEESGKRVSFDLSAFRNPGTKAKAVRTSGPWNAGENWTEIDPVPVKNKRLDVVLAPYSITSFVVRGRRPLQWKRAALPESGNEKN